MEKNAPCESSSYLVGCCQKGWVRKKVKSETKRKLKWKVKSLNRKVHPVLESTSVVAEAAILIQRRTPLSMLGLGALALRTGFRWLCQIDPNEPWLIFSLPDALMEEFENACNQSCLDSHKVGQEVQVYIFEQGEIHFSKHWDYPRFTFSSLSAQEETLLAIGQEMKKMLPQRMSFEVVNNKGKNRIIPMMGESKPSPKAQEILAATLPMLEKNKPRVLLLTGTPGVGKTVAANWIAQQIVGNELTLHFNPAQEPVISLAASLGFLAPKAILIDDIDKFEDLSCLLDFFDRIPKSLSIVILTANNGYGENVLDGSFVRCGRIDETWEITDIGIHTGRTPPFDKLDDETWVKVKFWSAASLAELAKRIEQRGIENTRLDDIATRENMRCLSNRKVKDRVRHRYLTKEEHDPGDRPVVDVGMIERMLNHKGPR